MLEPTTVLSGTLHVFVAFDWGEEVHLDRARQIVSAEAHDLPRRPRTPSSITYRPAPLRYRLGSVPLNLPEIGTTQAAGEATVFDFAGVSAAFRIPFEMPLLRLSRLAGALAEPRSLVEAGCKALAPLFERLKPAIDKPDWREDFSEEYFVFELPPGDLLPPGALLEKQAAWLAGLLRLDSGTLSAEEIADAVRLRLSYAPSDLFLPDWGASVLIDKNCEETLQIIEFSNLQLLEYRYIDNRLDDVLATAYRSIHPLAGSWLPFWRMFGRPRRALAELKFEANEVFERTTNVLKLVGDQYLARAYRQLSLRFHLEEWEQSIRRKLDVIEGVYKVLSDQAATARTELLEFTIVLLIVFEIVMAFLGHR